MLDERVAPVYALMKDDVSKRTLFEKRQQAHAIGVTW